VRNEAIHDDVIAILMLKIWAQPPTWILR